MDQPLHVNDVKIVSSVQRALMKKPAAEAALQALHGPVCPI
jgi:hypothetical protein